ncbi:hemophore-related protein [Nocardia sp. NPDC051052]|uniref:hemophore-related protein n=1 Tax=Nocardia sp. NPDC051052 TaxID=3364322 RepID=UPI0037BC1CF3
MKRTLIAATLTGFAGLAIALPAAASADPGLQCNPAAAAQARADSAPRIAAFLAGHPDFAAEIAKVRALPKDQRKAEWKSYRQAHPQEAQDFKNARAAIRDYRHACRK